LDGIRAFLDPAHEPPEESCGLLAPEFGHPRIGRRLLDQVFVVGIDEFAFASRRRALLVGETAPELTHQDVEKKAEVATAQSPKALPPIAPQGRYEDHLGGRLGLFLAFLLGLSP